MFGWDLSQNRTKMNREYWYLERKKGIEKQSQMLWKPPTKKMIKKKKERRKMLWKPDMNNYSILASIMHVMF